MAVMGLVLICVAFGPAIAPHDPTAQDLQASLQPPSAQHWLGTDGSGRDIASRVIVGARSAFIGPLFVALFAALIATVFGLYAGYRGGWRDAVVMRGADLFYAFPGLLVLMVAIGVLGGGYLVAVVLLAILTAPADVRLVRGATLEQSTLPYVDAARTLGLSRWRIMFRHIWPNILPLIVACTFLDFAYSLVALSALSFLGLGVDPGAPNWGLMLSDNLSLLDGSPIAVLAPGVALVATAVSMNLLGDWLYERMSDKGRAR
jgi:peptide/nickel transport system permease protein